MTIAIGLRPGGTTVTTALRIHAGGVGGTARGTPAAAGNAAALGATGAIGATGRDRNNGSNRRQPGNMGRRRMPGRATIEAWASAEADQSAGADGDRRDKSKADWPAHRLFLARRATAASMKRMDYARSSASSAGSLPRARSSMIGQSGRASPWHCWVKLDQGAPHALQLGDLPVDVFDMAQSQRFHVMARPALVVPQRQQGRHLLD